MDVLKASLDDALQQIGQTSFAGLEPALAVSVALIAATLLCCILLPRRPRKPGVPPASAPAPVKFELGEVSLEELAQYDGTDPKKPICVALRGTIYDVSRARHLYGPDGGYASFAGKDASRALAKMSIDPADITGDLSGLSQSELDSLSEWEVQYQFKYEVVGKLGTGS